MRNKISLFTYVFLLGVLLFSFFFYKRWKVVVLNEGDQFGYYVYLPAVLIYDDLATFEKTYKAREIQAGRPIPTTKAFFNEILLPNNHVLDKYTCGSAIMASPFSS